MKDVHEIHSLLTILIFIVQLVSFSLSKEIDPSIRIPAYDPKPVYLPDKMLARRIGPGPGVIQDLVRPTRQTQATFGHRKPSIFRDNPRTSNDQLLGSSPIYDRTRNKKREVLDESDLAVPLRVLSADELKNPFTGGNILPLGPVSSSATGTQTFNDDFDSSEKRPRQIFQGNVIEGPHPHAGTQDFTSTITQILPPSPPIGQTPSPPSGSQESEVTGIKCLVFGGHESFDALLTLPRGHEAVPVFEDRPMIDPTTHPSCRMIRTQLQGMFQLIVSSFESCGVRTCRQSNGEMWHCLILRFPLIAGLKLPEDELVEIRCRPHDRTADDVHVLAVATAKYADKSGM